MLKMKIILTGVALIVSSLIQSQNSIVHPNLYLTKQDVQLIKENLGTIPLFDNSISTLKAGIDKALNKPIDVPLPKDPAGGYTHTTHKQNYVNMFGAGILWQITGNKVYAEYVKKMLMSYADIYPSLPLHPVEKSYARGKLFWQLLNEAVWLIYADIAYDCIYDFLQGKEREFIENNLLLPYADFLSIKNSRFFNRIHNHGVWAVAAVGMTGFVTDKMELVDRALYGIENKKGKAGFFEQINKLFSPQGYYTEGPYYQRYVLTPFLLFAQSIEINMPEKKIFAYRDSVLQKAVWANLQLTNENGYFFPINDAIKEMSFKSQSMINAVDIIYSQFPKNKYLLSIAKKQNEVIISGAGFKVANALKAGKEKPFKRVSVILGDGSDGNRGAIGILRSTYPSCNITVLMKYATQGLGHGHFDRLSMLMYNDGNEILTDYGAVRFVNILYKEGGRYLPENSTWAKQTIAHNTITIDKRSDFNGNYHIAEKYHSEAFFFNVSNDKVQIMSAKENNAYSNVKLHRTIALVNDTLIFPNPVVVDIFRVSSNEKHTIDLAWHYNGQFMSSNVKYRSYVNTLEPLDLQNGYQHLWVKSEATNNDSCFRFIFMNSNRFYSLTSNLPKTNKVYFVQTGANDPKFNLRCENGIIERIIDYNEYVFVNTLEVFGSHNSISEITKNLNYSIVTTNVVYNDPKYTIVKIYKNDNEKVYLALSNIEKNKKTIHFVSADGKTFSWQGVCHLFNNQ